MNDYDFGTLSDKEFEILCTDLLSEELGSRIERFKPGKDKGIDGRYFISPERQVILQYKHWLISGFKKLLNYLTTTELAKISKLKPDRYILAVSLPLSKANKESIFHALTPHIKSESDIIGKEDLNDLLRRYPKVETNHFKLWLSSANVLKSLLNNAILGRSTFLISEICEEAKRYVYTNNYNACLKKLEESKNVIITGEPGIGKTTLAHQLILAHMKLGYEIVSIENDLAEAESLFSPDSKQLFYFDDFLGRNYLSALKNREDTLVVQFIRRIAKSKNKRFILTSRTNIFNQGRSLSIAFDEKNIRKDEFEIRIGSLTKINKAEILYNHLWCSNLSREHITEICSDERYLTIINHSNFNPRLIGFITDAYKVRDIEWSAFWPYIEATLDKPENIWAPVYDTQLSPSQRIMVMIVAFYDHNISEDLFKQSFENYLQLSPIPQTNLADTFESQAKILTGSLLNRSMHGVEVVYDLFNPSIGDFMISRFCSSRLNLCNLMTAIRDTQVVQTLKSLIGSEKITKADFSMVCETLLRKELESWQFRSSYSHFLLDAYLNSEGADALDTDIRAVVEATEVFDKEADATKYFIDLVLTLYLRRNLHIKFTKIEPAIDKSLRSNPDKELLQSLGTLLQCYDTQDIAMILEQYEAALEEFWCSYVHEFTLDNGYLDEYFPDMKKQASERAYEKLEGEIQDFFPELKNVCIDRILDHLDVDEILLENVEREKQVDDSYDYIKSSNQAKQAEEEQIRDLFVSFNKDF